jgi:hypothetical protein
MTDDSLYSHSSNDDVAEFSYLSEALENYLYVNGFAGECLIGSLRVPPPNPSDPSGKTLDSLIQYWLGVDRRRYSTMPYFVRQAKTQAAYERELKALEADLLPALDPPYTRQMIEDIRSLFALMDAYDRIMGIQGRVRRLLKTEVTRRLQGVEE